MNSKFKILVLSIAIFLLCKSGFSQNIIFNRTYGEAAYNYGIKIIETNDKGFLILGNSSTEDGKNSILLIKTDSVGLIQKEKKIESNWVLWANDFIQTSDNSYLITGMSNQNTINDYNVLLIKINDNLDTLWTKKYGGNDWDFGKAIIETKQHTLVVAGETYSFPQGNQNIYLLHLNLNGDTIWTKAMGGDSSDYATSLAILYDSALLVGANTNSFGAGNFDGYVINLNLNGDTIWTKTYGSPQEDILNSIKQTPDSGFVFVGSTRGYNAIEREHFLMRFDKNRIFKWMLPEFWTIGSGDDVFNCVDIDDSLNYIMAGFTTGVGNGQEDLYVSVTGDYINFKCSMSEGASADDWANYAVKTSDGGYVVIGSTEGLGTGITNIIVIKSRSSCYFPENTTYTADIENQHLNNFSDNLKVISFKNNEITIEKNNKFNCNFSVYITDLLGNTLSSDTWENIQSDFTFNLNPYKNGVYFISIVSPELRETFKVIKIN